MNIIFPYMARWHAVNWTRYHCLLSALADDGHKIYVLQPPTLDSEETNFKEIESVHQNNLTLVDVPIPLWLWQRHFVMDKLVKKALFSLYCRSHARRIVKDFDIDVILLYNIPQFFLSQSDDVVEVFDYADDYIDMLKCELGKYSISPVLNFADLLLQKMMTRADITLSVSHELGKNALGNIHVLPNGVDQNAKIQSSIESPIDLQELDTDKTIIGFIGSFEYFIDFDLILDAAEHLHDCQFLMVGTGRLYSYVCSEISRRNLSNIVLTGGVPHSDIFRYIHKMDICLNIFVPIPVSHRACPLKLFEYMSLKKPVITTHLEELNYIDEDFLYYADDAQQLVEQVKTIMSEPDKAIDRCQNAFDKTMQDYTWPHLAHVFVDRVNDISQAKVQTI